MILRKKSQAGIFEETYTALLTAEDRQFLSRMKQSRSWMRRIRLRQQALLVMQKRMFLPG